MSSNEAWRCSKINDFTHFPLISCQSEQNVKVLSSFKETQRLHREKRSHRFKFFAGLVCVNEVNEENRGKQGRSSTPDTHPDRREMIKRTENEGSRNSSYALVLLNGFFHVHGVC